MSGRTRVAAGAAVASAAAVAIVVAGGDGPADPSAAATPPSTAPVQRGRLSAAVSQDGILTYRARPDGSPYTAVNQAAGTYTALPAAGQAVGCGEPLYRVDDRPVLLLCGTVPAYRTLRLGDRGRDVGQLRHALHRRGRTFTAGTRRALAALQRRRGLPATGVLPLGQAVVLPGPVRIARVGGALGGPARPGAPVLTATSGALHVQVRLGPSEQGRVRRGDRALVTLPGSRTLSGRVTGVGRVAEVPAGRDGAAAGATVLTTVGLDDPQRARGLDQAPVRVDITTAGVATALSVPVTALVGRAGGGFAVERVGPGDRRDLIAVRVGLFDTTAGRVQVMGTVRPGDRVAVPSP